MEESEKVWTQYFYQMLRRYNVKDCISRRGAVGYWQGALSETSHLSANVNGEGRKIVRAQSSRLDAFALCASVIAWLFAILLPANEGGHPEEHDARDEDARDVRS